MSAFQASIGTMTGDSGSGGQVGLVPAPAAGDAAALKYLKADGTWGVTPVAANPSISTKSTTYTTLATDSVLLFNMSGSSNANYVVALLTAVGNAGLVQRLIITTGTGILTVNTTSAQTIGGMAASTITLASVNDTLSVVSDGANWQILDFQCAYMARYTCTAGPSIAGSDTIVNFANKVDDPNALVTTGASWKYTAPVPGKYLVTVGLCFDTHNYASVLAVSASIYKNGSVVIENYASMPIITGGYAGRTISAIVKLAAADTIDGRGRNDATDTLTTNAFDNQISIARIGP